MQKETRWFKSPRPMAAVGLVVALIIIAVAFVASGPKTEPAAQKTAESAEMSASAAADAPEALPITWHEAPRPLPTTVFKDAADADQTLANFAGKVLVVNFWATWCAPCVKEMPTLDSLQAKLGGSTFEVLAISQDREGARVAKPFAEKNEWKNLAFYVEAAGKFARDAKLRGLPTTLIVDKSGQEVARAEGDLKWDSPEVEKIMRDLIAKD